MKTLRSGTAIRRAVAVASTLLIACSASFAQAPAGPAPAAQQAAPLLSADQLDALVAPVALYPDPLLSQVLAASTYPLEVAQAQQWLLQNSNLQGAQLMDAAKGQNWDPSVAAMVAFPEAAQADGQRPPVGHGSGERVPGPAGGCDERGAEDAAAGQE